MIRQLGIFRSAVAGANLLRLLLVCLLSVFSTITLASTPPETLIVNTVEAKYKSGGQNEFIRVVNSASLTTDKHSPAIITFLQIAPDGVKGTVPSTEYNSGSAGGKLFEPITTVTSATGEKIDLPSLSPLKETGVFQKRKFLQ